jgi:hypothetical protein
MDDHPRSLRDQITLVHGPQDVLGRYFVWADQAARERGLGLRLRTDFERLAEVNQRNRASWPPLVPSFDPKYSNLRIDSAFWVEAIDAEGETVATHANRLFDWPQTTVETELRSLRVFYEDAAAHVDAGESVVVHGATSPPITGRNIFAGAVWVHPNHRAGGLATIVPRVSRAYAYTRWNPGTTWILVEPKTLARGLPRATGPFRAESRIVTHIAWRQGLTLVLLSMTNDALAADLARIVDQATDSSRRRERPRMNASLPAERHGISSRS